VLYPPFIHRYLGRLRKDFGRLWGDKEKEGRQTQEERRKQNQKEIYIYKLPINRSSGPILSNI